MKRIIQLLPFYILLCFSTFVWAVDGPNVKSGTDTTDITGGKDITEVYIEYGEIIEADGGQNEFIQVRDKILKVDAVFINSGNDVPVSASASVLKMGDIVQCYITEEKDGYWLTEKIILLKGAARQKYLDDSELTLVHTEDSKSKSKSSSQSTSGTSNSSLNTKKTPAKKGNSKIILKDGVYTN